MSGSLEGMNWLKIREVGNLGDHYDYGDRL
jgi:hypothetical protein